MAIEFTCPNCGESFEAPDYLAGKEILCPGCRELVQIPDEAEPATAP